MSKALPLSHYSPVFANQAWAGGNKYVSYFRNPYSDRVEKSEPPGRRQWGRKRGIYSRSVENTLSTNLENAAALIYVKILNYEEVNYNDRIVWAQFLLSQLVRTPTFIRYENFIRSTLNITDTPAHDRVGCKECEDLRFIANRDWCLLVAHKDDYFVRTDNPVLQTGFIEIPKTCLFYPLSPNLCFVACSMNEEWDAFSYIPNKTCGYQLEKGGSYLVNFHLAKTSGESLIISPNCDGLIAESMFSDVLGIYPQPPFSLHPLSGNELFEAYKIIKMIMSAADGINYPSWNPSELEPYYQKRR